MRKTFTRSTAAALTAATLATTFTVTQASAASVAIKPAPITSDFSARSRGAGAAVAFGALALIAGAAIAASQRDDYCGPYGCDNAYEPAPYYGYGPGYYGSGYRWHHWHHHWR